MKNIFKENLVKNIVVVILLFLAYPAIQNSLSTSSITLDHGVIGSLLVAVSILAVTACFGNFAFTYEKIQHGNSKSRLLAHVTTGLLMLLIGLSLEMTSLLAGLLIENFYIFNFSLVILYLASVLYDFWDTKRATQ